MPVDQSDLSKHPETNPLACLAGMSEKSLAEYQHVQVGNTCALHCICTAFHILTGKIISPVDLAEELDALPFLRRLPYRWWKDGPVAPIQQVSLIRYLARELTAPLSARLTHPTAIELITQIRQPGIVTLVTIGWLKGSSPVISLGEGTISYADNAHTSWHTLIAAAYDPDHKDSTGNLKPWGFINSWVNQGNKLFWMSDPDFIKSWSFYTPFGGIRPAVIITTTI